MSQQKDRQGCGSLFELLRCPDAVRILSDPYNPFPTPSAQTKSEFESKAAAINVTNESNSTFNLEEIKTNATWLSGKAKIDEVSALRIVLLEWQNRSRDQLLNKYSREEINSLRDAVGFDSIINPVDRAEPAGILAHTAAQNAGSVKADSQEARKSRLFRLFLSEKLHILKLARFLQAVSVGEKWPLCDDSGTPVAANTDAPRRKELAGIAETIFGSLANTPGGDGSGVSIQACVDAVRSRINNLETGSGWTADKDGEMSVEIDLAWQETTLDELYHVMQILFLQLKISGTIPSSEQLLSWLRLMTEYSFLGLFQPVSPTFNGFGEISINLLFIDHGGPSSDVFCPSKHDISYHLGLSETQRSIIIF